MALHLDNRQRAMLQEMGITVWSPQPVAIAAPTLQEALSVPQHATAAATAVPVTPNPAPARAAPRGEAEAPPSPQLPKQTPPPSVSAPVLNAQASATWRMAAPVQAFPDAVSGNADDAWLVIWECPTPHAPLEGDSGKLLANMLRALRLQHSPHIWIASMQRPGHDALPAVGLPQPPLQWQDLDTGLQQALVHIRPARILVLGMHAARAVLHNQEALGRLRAQLHYVHKTPTVVSYDPAYLLRAPHAKPAAWADLCRAHALRPPPAH